MKDLINSSIKSHSEAVNLIDEKEIYSHRGKAIRAIMNTLIPHLEQVKQMTKKEKA